MSTADGNGCYIPLQHRNPEGYSESFDFSMKEKAAAPDLKQIPIERALKDERLRLPFAKVSVGSATSERSKLRLAIKGAHPGFAAYLCELAKLEILALRRIRLGRVNLSDLEEGTWRYLAPGERF